MLRLQRAQGCTHIPVVDGVERREAQYQSRVSLRVVGSGLTVRSLMQYSSKRTTNKLLWSEVT
jgi:hypothetical protein